MQDALYKVTGRLRDDMFSVVMSSGMTDNSAYGRIRDPPFGSSLSLGISDNLNDQNSLTESMDHLGISDIVDRPAPPPSLLASPVCFIFTALFLFFFFFFSLFYVSAYILCSSP